MSLRFYNFVLAFSLMCFVTSVSYAEIYKWQDEKGRWHFGDSKPEAKDKPVSKITFGKKTQQKNAIPSKDLSVQLTEKYQPDSVVSEVTLSVVGVETHLGQGSGFFVSDDGYIVTNKHVIRPGMTKRFQQNKEQVAAATERLNNFKKQLDQEKRELDDYKQKLRQFKKQIDSKPEGSSKRIAESEYEGYLKAYQEREDYYRRSQRQYDQQSDKFSQAASDFNFKSSMVNAARQFTVVLKDGTELTSRLVKISSDHDLALLKVDDYATPKLTLGDARAFQQGAKVFAVGSPLGMRDSVTSGIIARMSQKYVVTDAQILPGNSGGPLVNESGEVIGVNTLKFAQDALADGFGMSIPISVVEEEFGSYLN